jgi:hypothetical protein
VIFAQIPGPLPLNRPPRRPQAHGHCWPEGSRVSSIRDASGTGITAAEDMLDDWPVAEAPSPMPSWVRPCRQGLERRDDLRPCFGLVQECAGSSPQPATRVPSSAQSLARPSTACGAGWIGAACPKWRRRLRRGRRRGTLESARIHSDPAR